MTLPTKTWFGLRVFLNSRARKDTAHQLGQASLPLSPVQVRHPGIQVSLSPLCPKHPSASGHPAGFWEPVQGPSLIMLIPVSYLSISEEGMQSWGLCNPWMKSGGTQSKTEVRQESRAPFSWPRIPSLQRGLHTESSSHKPTASLCCSQSLLAPGCPRHR